MSFDQEPERRYLLHHAESDVVFETYNGSEAEQMMGEGLVDDVTDIPIFEERFKSEQKQKGK